jgi:SAM-dependent methyltransferase/uncharacterized protein YbaR (Trm112 family)
MRPWVLTHLRCPDCGSVLSQHVIEERAGRVVEGVLSCDGPECHAWYPIARGIPRMLGGALRPEGLRHAGPSHLALVRDLGRSSSAPDEDALVRLKKKTMSSFGFEWTEYRRFGWDAPEYDLRREAGVFLRKSLLGPEDLRGRLTLDAGCGNGRYSYVASEHAGRVIGVDLSEAVDAAAENTDGSENVQIVQGDIFHPPFAPGTFDVIFSIGVLMHTGDAHLAVRSLRTLLAQDGSLTVHLYGKGNPIYELVDRLVRSWTTRRSLAEVARFTDRAYRLQRGLARLKLDRLVSRFVRLDPHPHCIFDWYSAPIATHHSYPEVRGWFEDLCLRVVATNEPRPAHGLRAMARTVAGSADTVTVRGIAG